MVFGSKMYLFGGSNGFESNTNMFTLDLNTYKWDVIREKALNNDHKNLPESADEHTVVVLRDQRILFGGFVNGERMNKTYVFNLKTNEWRLLQIQGENCPCPRAGHSAVVFQNDDSDYMYIFGGKDEENDKRNDLWRLDLN